MYLSLPLPASGFSLLYRTCTILIDTKAKSQKLAAKD